jgi:hypothetical protein
MDRDIDCESNGIVGIFLGVEISELKIGQVWWKYEVI